MEIKINQWYTFLGPDAKAARDEFFEKVLRKYKPGKYNNVNEFYYAEQYTNPEYEKAEALRIRVSNDVLTNINYRTVYKPEYKDLADAVPYIIDNKNNIEMKSNFMKEKLMNNTNNYSVLNLIDDYEAREANKLKAEFESNLNTIISDLPITKAAKKYINEWNKLGLPAPELESLVPGPESIDAISKAAIVAKNNLLIAVDKLRKKCNEARAFIALATDIYDARQILINYGIIESIAGSDEDSL